MKDIDDGDSTDICPDCHGTGRVVGQGGSIRVCMKCLMAGKMDQHTAKIKDAKEYGIKM